MKFGKSWDEVNAEPTTTGGFMKYFKDGDTTFRIIQEPKDWVGYWEHFNPGGFPFPCTGDRKTCPGCTSDNEKMKKASRKIAVNVLEGEYVNVYKLPKTLADKLANRAERAKPKATIMDRDYTISRFKSGDKVEYDIEGGDKSPVDLTNIELKDVEEMLQEAYNDSWGDSAKAQGTRDANEQANSEELLKAKLEHQRSLQGDEPPFEQPPVIEGAGEYDEKDLRAMDKSGILAVCDKEGLTVPSEVQLQDVDSIVEWLLVQQ